MGRRCPTTQSSDPSTLGALFLGIMSTAVPLISVIIPARDAALTIDACLFSIQSQRISSLEVLVADDGSSDETHARALRWSAHLPVSVLDLPLTRGASSARNLGLAHAAGKWVTFVDADDTVPKGAFAALLAEADRTSADVVIGAHIKRTPGGDSINRHGLDAGFTAAASALRPHVEAYMREPYRHTLLVHCWGKLFRRSLLDRAGVRFDEQLEQLEDVHFNYRVLSAGARIAYLDRAVYVHHIGIAPTMSSRSGSESDSITRMARAYGAIENFLREGLGLDAHEVRALTGGLLFTTAVIWVLRTHRRLSEYSVRKLARAVAPIVQHPLVRAGRRFYRLMPEDSRLVYLGMMSGSPVLCAISLKMNARLSV